MSGQRERQWSDQFGDHWEISEKSKNGAVHSVVLTRSATGWPNLDKARAEVSQRALKNVTDGR